MTLTLLTDATHELDGEITADGSVLIDEDALARSLGWKLEPQGLCRGDACVPVHDRAALQPAGDGRVDVVAVAGALGRPVVVDDAESIVAVGPRPDDLGLRVGDPAPDFTLPGVDGTPVALADSAGKKRLLLTWSSWCGCRHELPAWQEHYAALRGQGLELISIAVDDSVEAARPFVDDAAPEFRTAIDPDHAVVQAYGILNVPSAVWIDEQDRIARTPELAYGDRTWFEFHGVAPEPHLDALYAWVRGEEAPPPGSPTDQRRAPSSDEIRAQVHYRVGAHLHRLGRDAAAERHFDLAGELAPFDWTIRRGSLPLRGRDPFGADFFAFWDEWKDAGEPLY